MQINYSDIMNSIKSDEKTFLSFLKMLSVSYRYDFKQILMLYTQGYVGSENLVGYEFLKQKSHNLKPDISNTKKYMIDLCGKSVYLFSQPLVQSRKNVTSEPLVYRSRKYIEAFKKYTGLVVTEDAAQETFSIVNNELLINTNNQKDLQTLFIEASIDYKTKGCRSLFMGGVVKCICFGGSKLVDFEIISKLGVREIYNLLEESFTLYQELIYNFKGKYFTLTEVAVLSSCYECDDTLDSILSLLQNNQYAKLVLLNKLRGLRNRAIMKLIHNIKTGKVTHYPAYSIE